MGYGDEIMASGHVKNLDFDGKVTILDKFGRPRYPKKGTPTEVWLNNPRISQNESEGDLLYSDGPGIRPYIESYDQMRRRWTWNQNYRVDKNVGELFIKVPRLVEQPFFTIEPNVNPQNSQNKDWGFDKYQKVVDVLSKEVDIYQIHSGGPILNNVGIIKPKSFLHACEYIGASTLHIGTEGGLHHAAGVLGTDAIVIFGGYIGTHITGYSGHHNLGEGEGCGEFQKCHHCQDIMNRITVDQVLEIADLYW